MLWPTRSFGDLGDRCSFLAAEDFEHAVLFGAVLRFAKQKRRPSWKIERRLCRIVQSAQVSRCYAPNWIRDI